ncbi:MAG: response regulator [Prolixibacteraceae bacterium]|nr:response regulator [Prolixibacteraceae bacterium]
MYILLVDDNEKIWNRLIKAIHTVGENIVVLTAKNCKEAIRFINSFNPALVILDISLPDGSGIRLLRIIKSINPQVCVFMFTNYGTVEFKKSCEKLGADLFFEKTNFNELINSIRDKYESMVN